MSKPIDVSALKAVHDKLESEIARVEAKADAAMSFQVDANGDYTLPEPTP